MIVFELKEEYKKELKYYESTKQFFYYDGDIGQKTIVKDIEEKTLLKGITDGKIAIFPIYEKQKMDVVDGHVKLGFTVYFMSYTKFLDFRKVYINNCINAENLVKAEIKQNELF